MMTQRPAHVSEQTAPASAPPLGQFYEVGGRRLWLHRSGRGGPAVVFLPGASAVGLGWANSCTVARPTPPVLEVGGRFAMGNTRHPALVAHRVKLLGVQV